VNVLLKIITQTALLIALVIVVAGGAFILPPKISQMRRLEQQRNELMRKNDFKTREIDVLKTKQRRFASDPEFVEYVARQSKRVRPNELVFVFDNDERK
jgi:Tfp pilus assembly protein PilO